MVTVVVSSLAKNHKSPAGLTVKCIIPPHLANVAKKNCVINQALSICGILTECENDISPVILLTSILPIEVQTNANPGDVGSYFAGMINQSGNNSPVVKEDIGEDKTELLEIVSVKKKVVERWWMIWNFLIGVRVLE